MVLLPAPEGPVRSKPPPAPVVPAPQMQLGDAVHRFFVALMGDGFHDQLEAQARGLEWNCCWGELGHYG